MIDFLGKIGRRLISPFLLSLWVWLKTCLICCILLLLWFICFNSNTEWWLCLLAPFVIVVFTLPVLVVLTIGAYILNRFSLSGSSRISCWAALAFVSSFPYSLLIVSVLLRQPIPGNFIETLVDTILVSSGLFTCSGVAMLLTQNKLKQVFFPPSSSANHLLTQINNHMLTEHATPTSGRSGTSSNKTLIKALITGALILIMLIPTIFVANLVNERQQRQADVVKEVSSKWAASQTIAGPYLYVPFTRVEKDKADKPVLVTDHVLILPDNLRIDGTLTPEIRPRSIYKVLLYRTNLKSSGNFTIHFPKELEPESVQWQNIKLCFGVNDFKGIEEKIVIAFNGHDYELSPGLPATNIDSNGLSAAVSLQPIDLDKNIDFHTEIKMKGSEQLHFIPLSGNTTVSLRSTWQNPSFDGNNLPTERKVDQGGFSSTWTINKANLPYSTVLKNAPLNTADYSFGVSMLQPADQYAKTMRSVKYAILIIGLTFSLFFIVEVMQHKPVHPVQYILVGLALVIFYTLLLSLSEFILFDQAYLIAAVATIALITLYAKGHFKRWQTATLFGTVLSGLYGFIFVLVRLEDTALLIGSVGLFAILALVMYSSRNIQWYQPAIPHTAIQ